MKIPFTLRLTALGLAIALSANALASDTVCVSDAICCEEMPNPFDPVPIHKESTGAKWRHAFHDVRTTWDKYFEVYPPELEGAEAISFTKLRKDPGFYLDRKVQFDLYFAKSGTFYRPFTSPFHQDGYVNFNAWNYGEELWTKEGRGDVHPLLYVDKFRLKLIDKLNALPMFTPIHVWAITRSKSDGLPWIEIIGAEIIPEEPLREATLRHIEMGVNQLYKKRYDLAAQTLEAALCLQLPVNVQAKVYSMLGRAYYEQRLFPQSRNALVNSLLRHKANVLNLILLARTDLRINRPDEAKQAAEAAIVLEPTNPEARAELGLALAMLGDIRGGYRELEFAQRLAPRNQLPEANRNRAMIALKEGKLELARTELNQAVILRATDFGLHLELGDVHVAMNQIEDAKREFSQARDLAPSRPESYFKLALVLKGQGDALAKDNKKDDANKAYAEALDNVRQALAKDETFTPAYSLEAELLRLLGREGEIRKSLEKGAKTNPGSAMVQDAIYEQAAAAGDWDAMETALRAALKIKPTAERYSNLGQVLASRPDKDLAAAAQAFEQAVALDATRAKDWGALGDIHVHHLHQWNAGEAALENAVKLDPNFPLGWHDLAIARRLQGNTEGALDAAEEAAKSLVPEFVLLCAVLRLDRGTEEDVATAKAMAENVLRDKATPDEDKGAAHWVLGAALLKQDKVEEAVAEFKTARELFKPTAEMHLWYGTALFKQGDLADAQDELFAAIKTAKAHAVQSQVSARVKKQATKTINELQKVVRAQSQPSAAQRKTETATIETPAEKKEEPAKPESEKTGEKPVAKPAGEKKTASGKASVVAPVIEEPDLAEPVPIEVPRPGK